MSSPNRIIPGVTWRNRDEAVAFSWHALAAQTRGKVGPEDDIIPYMSVPILLTKLYIPAARPDLVSRSRLLEQLNQGLNSKLTLISAPAGFGKTTIITEWISSLQQGNHLEHPVKFAWYSLDAGDNDPNRFLAYLIALLRKVFGSDSIGEGSLTMLESPQPPPLESVLLPLINEIAVRPAQICFIFDDYHLIDSQPVHDVLSYLLANLPPQMRLVVATRVDPPLQISRLRALGQLTEIRALDLRFTSTETAEFLNRAMGLRLSTVDIAALVTRTEGWIAGLQLAAISLQGHKDASQFIASFSGSDRLVLDYLIEEILDQQPAHIRAFLLHTAICDRFTGALCDALTGQEDGQQILETLERSNLFIVPLDNERFWYRYHHLFSELLRQRLLQARPESVIQLHEQASVWYEQNELPDEAIKHSLRAEDFERAAYLIEAEAEALWHRGKQTKLRQWLNTLPKEIVIAKPYLGVLRAWDQFASGQQDSAEESLRAAEDALSPKNWSAAGLNSETRNQLTASDKMKIQGRVAAIRAFLAFSQGDVAAIRSYAFKALECLPDIDLTWRSAAAVVLGDSYSLSGEPVKAHPVRMDALQASKAAGNIYMTLIAGMKLALNLRELGQLEQVIETCQHHFKIVHENGLSKSDLAGWLLAIWGEVLAERDDLDEALDRAQQGARLAERGRDVGILGWSYLCLTRVLITRGDFAGAEAVIRRIEDVAREVLVPPWIMNLFSAWQLHIWLAQSRLNAISDWLENGDLKLDGDIPILHEKEYIVLARFLLANGQSEEAASLVKRLLERAEAGGATSRIIEILIIQAMIFEAQEDSVKSMKSLGRTITLAQSEGFVRVFVDAGPAMARLLYEALSSDFAPDQIDYIQRLLASFPVEKPVPKKQTLLQSAEYELIEPLTGREIEVLRLIAAGLSRQEIAANLVLSLNTVKAHARNIYGKLGVHSQIQAVGKARTLGLLEKN